MSSFIFFNLNSKVYIFIIPTDTDKRDALLRGPLACNSFKVSKTYAHIHPKLYQHMSDITIKCQTTYASCRTDIAWTKILIQL